MNISILLSLAICAASCSSDDDTSEIVWPVEQVAVNTGNNTTDGNDDTSGSNNELANENPGGSQITKYVDANGATAYIPAQFRVSNKPDEQTIKTGLVVIGPDGSEFVWVPTIQTALKTRDFGSYFYGGSIRDYRDDVNLSSYKAMAESVSQYGGFYMGRYEASYGGGSTLSDFIPASKPVTRSQPGRVWVQFSPQDATVACENLYRDNATVQGFFPWGANWDTTLQWLVDSGCKTREQIVSNSTSWGNYSDDTFSPGAYGNYTGAFAEAKANNIYDMAGNNWEWTQERYGTSYVMRGGGYSLMGGSCSGSRFPVAIRDPLPGNNHHPNVVFRVALFVK